MTRAFVMIIALCVVSGQMKASASGSAAHLPQVFKLGEARESVWKRMGAPQKIYVPETGRHYEFSEMQSVRRVYGEVEDVFFRKGPANEFEVRLTYLWDRSQSKLHPTVRVNSIEFYPDKDYSFREMLGQLQEARDLCANGCSVIEYGRDDIVIRAAGAKEDDVPGFRVHWDHGVAIDIDFDAERTPPVRIEFGMFNNDSPEEWKKLGSGDRIRELAPFSPSSARKQSPTEAKK
jgi:hypothetical protein